MDTTQNYQTFTQQEGQRSYLGEAVKLAVAWAAINIMIFLLTWYSIPDFTVSPAYGIINVLVLIGLAVYFTLNLRKKVGGYWDFKEALKHIFVLFFVQAVITTLFSTAFIKYIEPGYADFTREKMLNSMTQLYENIGMDQEDVDTALEQLEAQLDKQLDPTVGEFFQGLGIAVILYFVGALIFAAIFKRSRPVFAPVHDEEPEGLNR